MTDLTRAFGETLLRFNLRINQYPNRMTSCSAIKLPLRYQQMTTMQLHRRFRSTFLHAEFRASVGCKTSVGHRYPVVTPHQSALYQPTELHRGLQHYQRCTRLRLPAQGRRNLSAQCGTTKTTMHIPLRRLPLHHLHFPHAGTLLLAND
jgi:hypothetical protein